VADSHQGAHNSQQAPDREIERAKMDQDIFKHLTTFCSGAILVAATATAALFPDPQFVWLLIMSILCFATGVTASVMGLFTATYNPWVVHRSKRWGRSRNMSLIAGLLSVYFGIVAFSSFAGLNLMPNL
jgi:ABC-type nickel/cobalt efflux system permease component RcnA